MKPRRVIVTLEMTTEATLKETAGFFRSEAKTWDDGSKLLQVQVNVIRGERTSGKARRGRAK